LINWFLKDIPFILMGAKEQALNLFFHGKCHLRHKLIMIFVMGNIKKSTKKSAEGRTSAPGFYERNGITIPH
jgi:hypothetical protein